VEATRKVPCRGRQEAQGASPAPPAAAAAAEPPSAAAAGTGAALMGSGWVMGTSEVLMMCLELRPSYLGFLLTDVCSLLYTVSAAGQGCVCVPKCVGCVAEVGWAEGWVGWGIGKRASQAHSLVRSACYARSARAGTPVCSASSQHS